MKSKSWIVLLSLFTSLCCPGKTTKAIKVTGCVIDYQARPLEEATVICYGWSQGDCEPLGRTSTTPNGRFSLEVEATNSDSYLVAFKQGLALGWAGIGIDCAFEPIIRLGKPSLCKGTVVDEAGRPVSGAKLRMILKNGMMRRGDMIAPLVPEDWYTVRTDVHGQFFFDNIPSGSTADFGVEAAGHASMWTICGFGLWAGEQFVAGRNDIRIVLPAEARVQGQVVDKDTGSGVANVLVEAIPQSPSRGQPRKNAVTTDPNGRFELVGLAPDKYLLRVISDKMGSGHVAVNAESGQTVRNVRIPLIKGVPFDVIVYDSQDEEPIENATVEVTKKEAEFNHPVFRRNRATDANGLVRLSVPPGECEIRAWKLGRGWADSESIQIKPGQILRHEVFLPRTNCILSGDVLNEKGQPLSDALVRLWPGGFRLTYTDANGQFDTSHIGLSITPMPSKEQVFVRHVPSGSAAIGVLRDPTKSGNLHGRVILKPAYTLTGRVTDRAGNRIPAALVRLLVSGPSTGSLSRFVTEVATDMNGTYRICSIPPLDDGYYYTVAARTEGFGSTEVSGIRLDGETAKPVHVDPIVLQPADQSISGVVEDANEQPVASALVKVYGLRLSDRVSRQPHGKTLTDAQGRFRIGGVCKEPLRIDVESPPPQEETGTTWNHGGSENLRVVLGQRLIFSKSLTGKPLPKFEDIEIDFIPEKVKDNIVLVCFFDMNQRPSRHCIQQLAKQAKKIKQKSVAVVAVQVSNVKQAKLDDWIKENSISFPIGMVQGNEEQTRLAWGVRSLPWLVLTDTQHIVRAEGFNIKELDDKLKQISEESSSRE